MGLKLGADGQPGDALWRKLSIGWASDILTVPFEALLASNHANGRGGGEWSSETVGEAQLVSGSLRSDLVPLVAIGAATIVVHALTGNRYGFNRDELAILEDARHLAWGYVAYPPVTPFFGRIALGLFGTSLVGFRFFAALVQAIAVVLTGLMARDLGGRREAQLLAATAAVPFCLGGGALMQYISFDYFAWVLAAYFVVRLIKTENPRYCAAIGAAIGLGMLSKYTMLFFALGIAAAFLLTNLRKYFQSRWLWIGLGASLLIFFPNFWWQAQHHFVTYDFLRFIHARDVQLGLTQSFLPDQLEMTLLAAPLWIAGLYSCLFGRSGGGVRALGWMYSVPLVLFVVAKGRGYYLAPAYPMLYAAGAVKIESWLGSRSLSQQKVVRAGLWSALSVSILGAMAIALPLAPINSTWFKMATQVDNALLDEIGWQDLITTISGIRDALPPEDRSHLGILVENYGEVGAVNLYGPEHGLPRAISGVNSSWERGYGSPAPQALIVVGFSREFVEAHFTSCRWVAANTNSYGVENEETVERRDIFVCGPPKAGWEEFWKSFQYFA